MNQTPFKKRPSAKWVVAISSRALFELEECHRVDEKPGEEGYSRYQIEHEDTPLEPGVAFTLVKKLLAINTEATLPRVEVTLLSLNSADTGLRIFNSIRHLRLMNGSYARSEVGAFKSMRHYSWQAKIKGPF